MAKKNRGLGRGLDALLPEAEAVTGGGQEIAIGDIDPNPDQPRRVFQEEAIAQLNALLSKILPLRPLRDCGFTEDDIKNFPVSVEINQQRLITNSYVPMTLELMERIYRECY